MSRSYTEYSTDELLDLLEMAGRFADPALLEECLNRPGELTPRLLTMFEEPAPSEDWLGEDPRWFRRVHAGKLLLAFGEQEALPLFMDLLRDPEKDTLVEWFDTDLHVFGPSAVPAFVDLMRDPSAPPFGRHYAISTLQQIAQDHPEETREQVLEALREELPPVSSEGELQLPRDGSPEEVSYEEVEHWTFVTLALAELHDDESRDRVEALYEAELIEEMIIGDRDAYHEIRTGKTSPQNFTFDLLKEYTRRHERGPSTDTSRPELVRLLLDMLNVAGRAPRPKLIEALVRYREWVTPGLLEILEEDAGRADRHWDADDPERYRMNHAGLLLIHFRETDALSSFVEEFRQSEAETFNEWFEGKLRLYGPPAVPALADLVEDEDAGVWGRIEAAGELAHIGWAHDQARERVLEVLRGVLPANGDEALPDEAEEDQSLLWANVARELGRLGDEECRPLVEAMFDRGLIDTMILPDRAEYGRLLEGEGDTFIPFKPASYDVVADYERRYRQERKRKRREAKRKRRKEQRAERDRPEQATDGGHYDGGTFVRDEPKVGRNDPCPCGSGAKYKYCCG